MDPSLSSSFKYLARPPLNVTNNYIYLYHYTNCGVNYSNAYLLRMNKREVIFPYSILVNTRIILQKNVLRNIHTRLHLFFSI